MTPTLRARLAAGALVVASAIGALAAPTSASATPTSRRAAAAPRTATACPAASGNARYVRFVFREILYRCPDAKALDYWTRRLDAGLSRWSFAEAVDTSTENLGKNNVDQLYPLLLGRAPTATERAAGIANLRQAHANAPLTIALLSSAEGYAAHTSAATPHERDVEWLTFAYNRILDRAPDANGQAFYLGYFSAGGSTVAQRQKVALGLERSRPNALSWVRATMTEALGRTPEPSGVEFWVFWLVTKGQWQTFRLWTHQLASDEAYRRAQTQPN